MTKTATAKKKVEATTPAELAGKIWAELDDTGRVEFIEAWQAFADARLNEFAETRRPSSIPAGWMRVNWMARGGDHILRAYAIAVSGK